MTELRWVPGGGSVSVVLSGVATAARNAHFLRSCVPKDPHLVGAAEGCGPQVRELGTCLCVTFPLLDYEFLENETSFYFCISIPNIMSDTWHTFIK